MIKRILEKKLKECAGNYPVILLTGPRQSGKTTLCRAVFPDKPYISFENPNNRDFAEKDPKGLLVKYDQGAIFDEIQRCPQLLSYLQEIVDSRGKNGMYILTGSQNLLLLKSVQQSLAGRVAILKLLPLSCEETRSLSKNESWEKIIYSGFFPRVIDQKINPTEAMRNYIDTYVERDVRQIINVKRLSLFQRFLKLCAGRVGQILNLSSISNDLGVSHTTVREWMSVLEASYLVYLLPGYYRNFNKRIIKAPKLYFTDTGLACCLLGIEKAEHVSRDPLLGGLFENFVVIEILKSFWSEGRTAPLYFFRDNIGNEIDVLIEQARNVIGVEIKAGQTVNSDWFKGLNYLDKVMKKAVLSRNLVYGGKEKYTREGVTIFPYNEVHRLYKEIFDLSNK